MKEVKMHFKGGISKILGIRTRYLNGATDDD